MFRRLEKIAIGLNSKKIVKVFFQLFPEPVMNIKKRPFVDLRGDAYLEQSKQCASLGFFSRKTVTLLLITIRLLLRVHLKDSSVFFALRNINRFESYKR